jgi:hypothetical protein
MRFQAGLYLTTECPGAKFRAGATGQRISLFLINSIGEIAIDEYPMGHDDRTPKEK